MTRHFLAQHSLVNQCNLENPEMQDPQMAATIRKFTIVSAASALVIFEAFIDVLESLPKGPSENLYIIE